MSEGASSPDIRSAQPEGSTSSSINESREGRPTSLNEGPKPSSKIPDRMVPDEPIPEVSKTAPVRESDSYTAPTEAVVIPSDVDIKALRALPPAQRARAVDSLPLTDDQKAAIIGEIIPIRGGAIGDARGPDDDRLPPAPPTPASARRERLEPTDDDYFSDIYDSGERPRRRGLVGSLMDRINPLRGKRPEPTPVTSVGPERPLRMTSRSDSPDASLQTYLEVLAGAVFPDVELDPYSMTYVEGEVGVDRLSAAKKVLRAYYKLPSTERIKPGNRQALSLAQNYFERHYSEAPRRERVMEGLRDQLSMLVAEMDLDEDVARELEDLYSRVGSAPTSTEDRAAVTEAGDRYTLYCEWRELRDQYHNLEEHNPLVQAKPERVNRFGEIITDGTPDFRRLFPAGRMDQPLESSREEEAQAYLTEAASRGYFEGMRDFFVTLDDAVQQQGPKILEISADPTTPAAVEAQIMNWIARTEEIIARDPDGARFAGMGLYYAMQARDHIRKKHSGEPDYQPRMEGLYARHEDNRYWDLIYANTYRITANNIEQLQIAMNTFFAAQTVESPVHRTAQDIFGQINVFGSAITEAQKRIVTNLTVGVPPEELEEKKREVTGEMKEMSSGMQLKFLAHSCFHFGKLGQHENFVNMFNHLIGTSPEGLDVLNSARDQYDGLLILASRLMQTREWTTIFRQEGENGGLAGQEGDDKYEVQKKMEAAMRDELAEAIMFYRVNDIDPATGRESERAKKATTRRLGNFQLGERFDPEDPHFRTLYRVDRGLVALCDRGRKIEHKKRQGRGLSLEVQRERDLYVSPEEDRVYFEYRVRYDEAFRRAREAVETAYQLEAATGDLSVKADPAFIVHIKAEHSPSGVERVDYMRKEHQIGFVLTAEALAHIRAANMRIIEPYTKTDGQTGYRRRPLIASEVARLAQQARARAYQEIQTRGFGARLTDDNGDEIQFVIDADTGQPDLNTAGLRYDGSPVFCQITEGVIKPVKIIKERRAPGGREVAEDTAWGDILQLEGRRALIFDEAATHLIGKAPDATYMSTQAEKFRQLFALETYEKAVQLRAGKITIEEAGFMACYLLMMDPGLQRLRQPEVVLRKEGNTYVRAQGGLGIEERKAIVDAQNGWNHRRRLRATSQLRRIAFGPDGNMEGVYFGSANMTFVTFKQAHAAEFMGIRGTSGVRRGRACLWFTPDSFRTLSQMYGMEGFTGLLSTINLESEAAHTYQLEAIDTAILAGWANFLNAHENLFISIFGGSRKGENYVSLFEKLTADADAAIQLMSKTGPRLAAQDYEEIKSLLGYLKRLLDVFGSIREVETVARGEGGAGNERFIEGVQLFEPVKDRDRNVIGEVFAEDKIGQDMGSGRISEKEFYGDYLHILLGPIGKKLYPTEQPLMAYLLGKDYRTVEGTYVTGANYVDQKGIR